MPLATPLSERLGSLMADFPSGEGLERRDASATANFRQWSKGYDQQNAAENYHAPDILADLAATHLPPDAGPILDLACGSGLLGRALSARGFSDLLGCDLSPEMLSLAEAKGCYRRLTLANLHQPLPFAAHSLAALVCCGAFYVDSVEVLALAHALPLLRPGGWLICDVELEAWTERGFEAVLTSLADNGHLQLVHLAPIQMFRPAFLGSDHDEDAPQGMAVVARLAFA